MSQHATPGTDPSAVEAALSDVTYDMLPAEGFEEALAHVPDGARIAVVLTPDVGIEPTVERTEQARDLGYEVVPHVAPRFIEDRDQLAGIAERLTDAGVTDIFVPGGDRDEPIGEFSSAYEMLVALDELGVSFEEVGITGYPTGHGAIDDSTLRDAMDRKAPYATYLVTQLCFDAEAILAWIEGVRDRGIDLPVEIGIPGVMHYRRLMTLARKWGIAGPIGFIRKTTGFTSFVREFVGAGGKYRPDEMVETLAPYREDPDYDIRRLRLYTFNQTGDTESWRRERVG